MEDLQRVTAKIFASNAAAGDIGQYGSALSGTKVLTDDIATIQGLPAYEVGWRAAVLSTRNYPTLQEMNGLQKTFSYQLAYILQKGIAKWDSGTEYYINDFCSVGNEIYVSIANNNINHDPTELNSVYWNLYSPGLGTYANQSLSNLNTTGQAVLDAKANVDLSNLSATGESHFANPSLSNLDATGQAVLDAKADVDLLNINSTAKDFINNSKALETGRVGNNADVYADILKYAHSTFDNSKFSISGTPTVSNDGILSQTDNSNYLAASVTYNNVSTIKATAKFNTGLLDTTSQCPLFITPPLQIYVQYTSGGTFYSGMRIADSNNNFALRTSAVALSTNTDYYAEFSYNVTTQQLSIKVFDANYNLIDSITNTSTNAIVIENGTYTATLGKGNNISTNFNQDLKFLTVETDGVTIFNGNKTGFDIIKSDNYTVVGTPTITTNGVASGFSNSNYIAKTLSVAGKTFKINLVFKVSNNAVTQYLFDADTLFDFDLIYVSGSQKLFPRIHFLDSNFYLRTSSVGIENNTWYQVEFIYDSVTNKGTINLYDIYGTLLDTITGTPTSATTLSNTSTLNLGYGASNLELDLNSIEVYVDGNLIYQPCLKIPYNISKTGSKVVDVYARPRVSSMHEQYGYAPYYTIDEINQTYTLPMGEVYGMMLNQSTPHIIEVYRNGSSYYNLYSNGFLEQGGKVTVTDGYGIVNLLKQYGNTDYLPIVNGSFGTSIYDYLSADIYQTDSLTNSSFRILASTQDDTPAGGTGIWQTTGYIS